MVVADDVRTGNRTATVTIPPPMSTDPDSGSQQDQATEERPPGKPVLEARLVRYERQPNELTISPRDVDRSARMTTWISAREGSFVDLDSVR